MKADQIGSILPSAYSNPFNFVGFRMERIMHGYNYRHGVFRMSAIVWSQRTWATKWYVLMYINLCRRISQNKATKHHVGNGRSWTRVNRCCQVTVARRCNKHITALCNLRLRNNHLQALQLQRPQQGGRAPHGHGSGAPCTGTAQ
jgi:hypothetical protein